MLLNRTPAISLPAADAELLKRQFKRSYNGKYGRIYTDDKNGILLCQVVYPYIPIADFRAMFERMTALARKRKFNRFIFDKRALKSFDQPSMEWYFTEWKAEMLTLGVQTHRKILPGEKWFEHAVIAGRADIRKRYPTAVAFSLDIQYCDNIVDSVNSPAVQAPATLDYIAERLNA